MKTLTRAAALFLSLLLCLSLLPAGALASDEPEAEAAVSEEQTDITEAASEEAAVSEEAEEDEAAASEEPVSEDAALSSPEADGSSILPGDLYLVQTQRGTCTLASCAMMLRSRAYLAGNASWSSITETGIRPTAWLSGVGLYNSFTYRFSGGSITVASKTVSGFSVSSLKALLDEHPEGIVFYVYDVPHAIFVSDYEGDVFYGSDPANSSGKGRKPIANTWLGSQFGNSQSRLLGAADKYWYVSSASIQATTYYTVTFDANGGEVSTGSRTVAGQSAIGSLPTPSYPGYVFAGWYTAAAGGTRVYDSTAVTGDTTLYAHWADVHGTITLSDSPLTINLARGMTAGSVTVSCSGELNDISLSYSVREEDRDAISVTLGAWDGLEVPVTIRVSDGAVGTYPVTFTLTDAETGRILHELSLPVAVIDADISLKLSASNVVFDRGTSAYETIYVRYEGIDGDVPSGYSVRLENNNEYCVTCEAGTWNGTALPIYISPNSSWSWFYPVSAVITVSLAEPDGAVYSRKTVTVTIVESAGQCGDNLQWTLDGSTLRLSLMDSADPDGYMWNYEIGNAPWYPMADRIEAVTFGNGITHVGTCAFADCTALRSVSFCDTLTDIGRSAFSGCTALSQIAVPGNIKEIGTAAFYGCTGLDSIVLSDGVERMASMALSHCAALESITIPQSVSEFWLDAPLAGVRDVYYGGDREQWAVLDDACGITENLPASAIVHIGQASETEYGPADAANVLQYAANPDSYTGMLPTSADANGNRVVNSADAALILRQIVGLA